jgi:hypothetical protein
VVNIDGVLKIRPSASDVHAVRAGNGGKPNPKEEQKPQQLPAPGLPEPTESVTSGNTPIVAANPAKVRSLEDFMSEDATTIPEAPTEGYSSCKTNADFSVNGKVCTRTITTTYTMFTGEPIVYKHTSTMTM